MQYWQEFRTAYLLAKLGTVSAAADEARIHRATVIRHVDTLEAALETKLFLRHTRGYQLTETGEYFLHTAKDVDGLIGGFIGRVRGQRDLVSGKLVITTIPAFSSIMMEPINKFRKAHPEANVTLQTSFELPPLEHGKVHIAFHHGYEPTHDDYVVQPLAPMKFGLYAHESYIERKGVPQSPDTFDAHDFVGNSFYRMSFEVWLTEHVAENRFLLMSSSPEITHSVVFQGLAIGFMPQSIAKQSDDIREVMAPQEGWSCPAWLVTHVDLHRTPKVQAMLDYLKEVSL
ncbi:MAG: LysR family transcriptional regulator [Pseudomonadota bacterium]